MTAADSRAEVRVRINFTGGEDLPILYASNVFVRFDEHAFLVSFAQAHGPYELTPDASALQEHGIDAKVIARIAVPPDKWGEILGVLTRNYANWVRVHGGGEQEPTPQNLPEQPQEGQAEPARRRVRTRPATDEGSE